MSEENSVTALGTAEHQHEIVDFPKVEPHFTGQCHVNEALAVWRPRERGISPSHKKTVMFFCSNENSPRTPDIPIIWTVGETRPAFGLGAVVCGTIALGGGIYETLLVDRVWPDNIVFIQPRRGGLDRKFFWAPIHTLYEIALLVSAWTLWGDTYARSWIVVALIVHFGTRAWSFAYFIPKALQFERLSKLTESQIYIARKWIRLSRCRPILEAVSIISLSAAILHFGSAVHK
jgi:hypothetical protein